jgi:hypothetical protein
MSASGQGLRETMSHLHPIPRMGAELAFGRSAYFGGGEAGGRDLRTLTPQFGQAMKNLKGEEGRARPMAGTLDVLGPEAGRAAEYGVSSMPFVGRAMSELSRMSNPRTPLLGRVLGFLGISRIHDVSPRQMMALQTEALNERASQLGGTQFKVVNIPEDVVSQMIPRDRQEVEQLRMLRSILGKRMKLMREAGD